MRISRIPLATATSTTNWIAGLSTIGIISFGIAFVYGRKREPKPAAGMTAFIFAREEGASPINPCPTESRDHRAGKGYQARATCRAEFGPPEAGLPARGDDESPPHRAALPSREGRGRMERPRPRPVPCRPTP